MSRKMVEASGGLSDQSALNRVKNIMLSANFVSYIMLLLGAPIGRPMPSSGTR